MSNRRRQLSSVHRTLARKGVNAAAWFAGQSFTSASRGDMLLERLTVKQLDQAGAALLPAPTVSGFDPASGKDRTVVIVREVCPVCLGSREVQQQVTDNLTVTAPCAECGGRGYYVEGA